MTKIRSTIVILLTLAILCSLFVRVFAVGNSGTEDEVLLSAANNPIQQGACQPARPCFMLFLKFPVRR